jgi:hypothetical protein
MRSLRDWIAGAPTASLAAALGFVVVGAGLFGFAIAELTSGDGGGDASAPAQAPAVVGGSTQPGGVPHLAGGSERLHRRDRRRAGPPFRTGCREEGAPGGSRRGDH